MEKYVIMENLSTENLQAGNSFTGDLIIDSTFLLLPKMADITESMIKCLKAWEFKEVICEGSVSLTGEIGITAVDEEIPDAPKEKISNNVIKAIENSKASPIGNSDQARMDMVTQVYNEYMNYIESVFTHYATHKKIDQQELEESVQELCIFIKEHRRYILRVNPSTETSKKNFLVIHSMRTTVLAITIGLQEHLPLSK